MMPSVDGFVVLISKYLIVWLRGGFQSDERNAHVESRVSPGKATNSRAPSSGTIPVVSGEEGPPQGNREPHSLQKPWAAPAGRELWEGCWSERQEQQQKRSQGTSRRTQSVADFLLVAGTSRERRRVL